MAIFMFFLVLALLLPIARVIDKANQGKKKAKNTRLLVGRHFPLDELYVSDLDTSLIGLSFAEQKVLLGNSADQKSYHWSRVTSVEIIQNGATLNETNRGSQFASAVVGGALFGPLGALAGGLSGSSTSSNRITELSLKIIVDDASRPVYIVTFFRVPSKAGVPTNSNLIAASREKLERMHGHLINAFRRVASSDLKHQAVMSPSAADSSVQHLEKLWDLKDKGILTEEEFAGQKAKILSGNPNISGFSNSPSLPPPQIEERIWRVVLKERGLKRIETAKVVNRVTSMGLPNAYRLLDRLPQVLRETQSRIQAEDWKQAFDGIATVAIE